MSNETDRLVSDAYNELANERTPETLNQEVLRLAAKEGRTRYSIARAWMRPLAWAATVGLSLVVVLELTNVPEPEMASLPQSAPSEAPPADADRRRDLYEEAAALESEAREERQEALAKRSRPYSPAAQSAEKAAQPDDAPAAGMEAARDSVRPQDPVATSREFEGLGEPVERARSLVAQPSLVAMDAEPSPEADYLCPAEARASAEQWLECILELEASSPPEVVAREYEALRESYPDVELPGADR